MKRLALICALLALAAFALPVQRAGALATDFTLLTIDCSTLPGHISVQNISGASATFDQLSITITQPSGASITKRIIDTVTPPGTTGGNYAMAAGGVLDMQVGPGATQSPNPPVAPIWPATPPVTLNSGQSLVFSAAQLLNPGAIVTLFDASSSTQLGTQTCQSSGFSRTLTVSTLGFDFIAANEPNSLCGPDLPVGTTPTLANPGPCFTIANALTYARDGDTIVVEAGIYEICAPIEVSKLVRITANGAKTILHSYAGQTVFHVTAIGGGGAGVAGATIVGPANISGHAAIDGFQIGGVTQAGAAAIFLDGDAYTDVTNNVLGGETLNNPAFSGAPCNPPAAGTPYPHTASATPPTSQRTETFGNTESILLASSDHPNISNNTIQGSSSFPFVPVLSGTPTDSGFGIVTIECLGLGSDISDSVKISANLINRNGNAGIWMCSDGGGSHLIQGNIIRNNGRGIVLRAIADSTVDSNTITDDFQDGMVVYDASENNTISNNLIESNRTPGAAGIRVGDFGAGLFPLQTVITANRLTRNWIGIDIAGARNTSATNNVITSESLRTGVLIEVGGTGAPSLTQPDGTVLHQNQIVANGPCNATSGCAIRLGQGVTVDVDANPTNFGLPSTTDPNSVLWHKPNDPSLGYINAGQTNPPLTPGGAPPSTTTSPAPTTNPTPTTGTTPTGGTSPSGTTCTGPNTPPGCTPPVCTSPGVPPYCTEPGTFAPGASTASVGAGAPSTGVGAGAGASTSAGAGGAGGSAGAGAGASAAPSTGTTLAVTSGFNSPVLHAGQPGGTTSYSPICSFVSVPSGLVSTVSVAEFLSQFQPVSSISSAWRVNNATHTFQALYFKDSAAPVEAITLRRGDIVAICVSSTVQGPP